LQPTFWGCYNKWIGFSWIKRTFFPSSHRLHRPRGDIVVSFFLPIAPCASYALYRAIFLQIDSIYMRLINHREWVLKFLDANIRHLF
jgi:hypothetical protein